MTIIKKLDMYLLKAYLQLFAGTFFICLFLFLMQFTWRYVNDLIGKGLSVDVLAQFFWYATLTLVPMSLPLAVLLAALITFGNFGERLELLSMKAAGIPLIRVLLPVFIFVASLSVGNFYFQNHVSPEATKQLGALVYSMKQKSPEMEIPEGVFYSEIPGYNFYVERKDLQTGVLHGVMIYSTVDGYEDAQIIVADSGRIQSTSDRKYLMLTLYGGERFRNMTSQGGQMMRASVPYMRETFGKEVDLIPFDANFDIMDAALFAGNAQTKDITSIEHGIDSLTQRIDSVGQFIYEGYLDNELAASLPEGYADSAKVVERAMAQVEELPFDSVMARLNDGQRQQVWKNAQNRAHQMQSQMEFRVITTEEDNQALRIHEVEWHKKFTLSLACLVFFFIGAPLGAIIRKGGLGMPVVISVLIFIFYYVVNSAGEKLAKQGSWDVMFGVWLSSMVLIPIAGFLTYKANGDSTMFNIEGYLLPLQKAWKAYQRFSFLHWLHGQIANLFHKLKEKRQADRIEQQGPPPEPVEPPHDDAETTNE